MTYGKMFCQNFISVVFLLDLWIQTCFRLDVSICSIGKVEAVKPVLDLANNMRLVLVPGKTNFIN